MGRHLRRPGACDLCPRLIESGPPPGRALSFLVFGIGWVLFGLASLVGRVYPRSASALLIVGAVIYVFYGYRHSRLRRV